jgi:hypothetical protein
METEADKVKRKLQDKPDLIGKWKPETFWDETPLDDNLYIPVLNKWIREIKRQLIPVPATVNKDLHERLIKARAELVRIEKERANEEEQEIRNILRDEANKVREDIAVLEREWNNLPECMEYLNTPIGSLWMQGNNDNGDGDIYSKKIFDHITNEHCPIVYQERLKNLSLEEYNAIIRKEKDLANDMAIMTMGVGLAIGDPGSGKSAFLTFWCYMLKYLFGYKAVLDVPPRKLFGEWYLFNTEKLKIESERTRLIQSGKISELEVIRDDNGVPLPPEAQWAAANASQLFYQSCFGAEEYSDYYPRLGQGRTRMGAALFNFHRKWRHNNLLILGATPKIEEVDINMCQHYITHHVFVSPHPEAPKECTVARIVPRRLCQGEYVTDVKREPFDFEIWGLEPRDFLGGECVYHLFNTKNRQRLKLPTKLRDGD